MSSWIRMISRRRHRGRGERARAMNGPEIRANRTRYKGGSAVAPRAEFERDGIDAIPLPGWWRSVGKDVAEMAVATCAARLGAGHAVAAVAVVGDRLRG